MTLFDQIALALLGLSLSFVAGAALYNVWLLSEQARFQRYARLRELLHDLCREDGSRVSRLLAMQELGRYPEYSGVVASAMAQLGRPKPIPVSASKSSFQRRDILEGVVVRRRGEPVKGSVLREFLRFRDAVIYR